MTEEINKEEGPAIRFQAYLAGVNTAAKPLSFDIDGASKIAFETSENETGNVIPLLALGRSLLDITIRVVPGAVAPQKKKRGKKTKAVDTETGAAVPD